MPAAGQYTERLRRQVRTVTKNTDNGQDEEVFTPGDYFWCRVEVTAGRRQQDYGANQTGADVTIYVRNVPTLSALDRMTDPDGIVYVIEHIRKGDDELLCDANYYDALSL